MAQQQLFVSYNSVDRTAAAALVEALDQHDVGTFFDRQDLVPGHSWPQALEANLDSCSGAAIVIGPAGLGLWQKREMGYALDRQVREERRGAPFPVIPVMLPGADAGTGFLFLNTWIEYSGGAETVAVGIARALAGSSGTAKDDRPAICPYQGLRSFSEESAAFFVGRDAETRRLLEDP